MIVSAGTALLLTDALGCGLSRLDSAAIDQVAGWVAEHDEGRLSARDVIRSLSDLWCLIAAVDPCSPLLAYLCGLQRDFSDIQIEEARSSQSAR